MLLQNYNKHLAPLLEQDSAAVKIKSEYVDGSLVIQNSVIEVETGYVN